MVSSCLGHVVSREKSPDFLIIGAAKSATTSLYRALERFDDIFMTEPKEPAFFSNPERLKLGLDWYRELFASAGEGAMRGEASTTYSRYPYDQVPNTVDPWPRIAREFPRVKMVYLVRHPVERAYSHYRHWMRSQGFVDFCRAVEIQPPILDCSRYRLQIEHVERFMGAGSVFIETFDRFGSDPAGVVADVRSFLGLEPRPLVGSGWVENRHEPRRVVSDQLARVPGVLRVRRFIPKPLRVQLVDAVAISIGKSLFRRQICPPSLGGDMRARLLREFVEDTAFIESRLGRSLHGWRS